jgi:hypothetical protein
MQLGDSLRRACCILAFFLAIASVVMGLHGKFHTSKLPPGMKSAGIAMELVRTNQDVWDITADPSDQKTLREQQQLDRYLFIPCYLLFFVAMGTYTFVELKGMRWFGIAIALLVIAAAICDYFEDAGIIYALDHLEDPHPLAISSFGYWKWGLIYMMLICTFPLFWRRWHSASLRILGLPFGLYAVFSGGAGAIGCLLQHGGRVESAASGLAAPVLFFVPFVALFHQGTLPGLTWLAGVWPFRWIVRWPEWKEPTAVDRGAGGEPAR